jgi:dolichyl-diphosphooligosaccharide--protein glycosyltransferase
MASQLPDVFFQGNSGKSTRASLRVIILLTIAAAAVAARLFSVRG